MQVRGACARLLRNTCSALLRVANTEKKGICALLEMKKCLRQRCGVLFFAPITHARQRDDTTFEE
jgi:hypothetical protein